MTRRSLLLSAAALPARGGASGRPIRLGGPIFLKSDDPAELAAEHRRLGYSAAYCPKATAADTARVRAIEDEFRRRNVVIAEVGAWVNLIDADGAKRRANLDYVAERLALADAVGARCCVDIGGSYNPTRWDGPDPRNISQQYFDQLVENCRKLIDSVRPKRTRFAIEMMWWALPDSPEEYLRLVRAVDRPAFGVHVDVCNIIVSPRRYYNNSAIIRETFRLLGGWIVSCHAKDLLWERHSQVHFTETVPGRGGIDYATYLGELSRLPVDAPLMLEHLKLAEEYEEGKQFIFRMGKAQGLTFA